MLSTEKKQGVIPQDSQTFGRIDADETPRCVVPVSASIHVSYGQQITQSEPTTTRRNHRSLRHKPEPASALRPLAPAARQWVDTTLRSMTVDEKIGQLLFTTYHGTFHFDRFAGISARCCTM